MNPQASPPPPPQPPVPPTPPVVSGQTPQNLPPPPLPQSAAPTAAQGNPNSTQNTLQIAEIRDGIVIVNDGSFRSVIMVKSINFDLMSPGERDAIEYSYQGFLNSLYFPIQIFIRSQKVDLRPYIDKLEKIRSDNDNMLLALLMEDYITFIDELASQTNIMEKSFYIVIPYFSKVSVGKVMAASKGAVGGLSGVFSKKVKHVTINEADLNTAKDELRNRVQACLNGLLQAGLQGLPLDTQELIELYYNSYNPDTAIRQQLTNFDDLTTPVVTKGQGTAPLPNLGRTDK